MQYNAILKNETGKFLTIKEIENGLIMITDSDGERYTLTKEQAKEIYQKIGERIE